MEELLKICIHSNYYIQKLRTFLNKVKDTLLYISEKQRSNSKIEFLNTPLFKYYVGWSTINQQQAKIVS